MGHPDEQTLELFAVGSRRLGEHDVDVREHIAECPDCRRIVEEKREFYAGVGSVLKDIAEDKSDTVLGLPSASLPTLRQRPATLSTLPGERLPFHQEAARFFRHHPVVSSGGLLAGLALLGWLIVTPRQFAGPDADPSYARVNLTNSSIEVFNKSDQPIWSKPVASPHHVKVELDRNLTVVDVLDVEGDGHHEVATTLPLLGDTEYDAHGFPYVRFFSGDKKLLSAIRLGHEVSFGGRKYADQFGYDGLASSQSSDEARQLLVAIGSHFRSPSVVAVIEKGMKISGEYWHYGHLTSPVSVRGLRGKNSAVILVFGQNDAADSAGIQYPVMAVLDPQRISGMTESHLSRGFGYPACPGEIAYVRFPVPDVAAVVHGTATRIRPMYRGNTQISLIVEFTSIQIEYVFSLELKPISARPLPGFAEIHAQLVKEGKIHSTYSEEYIRDLREGVRFWDGKEWTREAVFISDNAK